MSKPARISLFDGVSFPSSLEKTCVRKGERLVRITVRARPVVETE